MCVKLQVAWWKLYLWVLCLLIMCKFHVASRQRDSQERNSYNKPVFKPTAQNITVGPGDRAVLRCRVENLGTKTLTWRKKNEVHPMTIGLFPFVGDTRVSVDYNQRTNEWSLIIQDVRPSDEGIYQCSISTKQDQVKDYEVKLNVKNDPNLDSGPAVQVSGSEYVEKGGQVYLMCNATGKPDPPHDVEWFKDGTKIESGTNSGILITKKIETKVLISVLVIKNSKMKDAGDYVCRSTNRDAGKIKVHILNDYLMHRSGEHGNQPQHVIGANRANSLQHPGFWKHIAICILSLTLLNLVHFV